MPEEIFNINEACRFLGIQPRTMYALLKKGEIPAVKVGGQWRFYKEALLDLFRQPTMENISTENKDYGNT